MISPPASVSLQSECSLTPVWLSESLTFARSLAPVFWVSKATAVGIHQLSLHSAESFKKPEVYLFLTAGILENFVNENEENRQKMKRMPFRIGNVFAPFSLFLNQLMNVFPSLLLSLFSYWCTHHYCPLVCIILKVLAIDKVTVYLISLQEPKTCDRGEHLQLAPSHMIYHLPIILPSCLYF